MQANLKLAVNTPEKLRQQSEDASGTSIRDMVPKRHVAVARRNHSSSYGLLITVLAIHVMALLVLLKARDEIVAPEKLPAIMTVSLVGNPAPELEVTPVRPEVAQPEIKKLKPVAKQKLVKIFEPTNEQVVEEQLTKETDMAKPVVTETPAEPANTAKVDEPVVTEPAKERAKEKEEAEPVIELPKFGAAYLNNPAPAYPGMSRRLGEQGRVLLKVLVTEDGKAETVQLENSSGYIRLDEAAIEAVKQWTFIPAKRSKQPMSAYVLVPVKFSLNS